MKEIVDLNKSRNFAVMIIALSGTLKERHRYVLVDLLSRSGTSIGSNIEASVAAQSQKDFISNIVIASKEAGVAISASTFR